MSRETIEDTLADLDCARLIAQKRECIGMLTMCAGTDEQVYRFRNNSLGKAFAKHQQHLVAVHDLCAIEMHLRGYKTERPVLDVNCGRWPNYAPGEPFIPTLDQQDFDRQDLISRYRLHVTEVKLGLRKFKGDCIRWKAPRSFPIWVPEDIKDMIREEQLIQKGKVINV